MLVGSHRVDEASAVDGPNIAIVVAPSAKNSTRPTNFTTGDGRRTRMAGLKSPSLTGRRGAPTFPHPASAATRWLSLRAAQSRRSREISRRGHYELLLTDSRWQVHV